MTREQAIRTVDQLISSGEKAVALFVAGCGVVGIGDDILASYQEEKCTAVAAWLREIADALDGGTTDAK